MKFLLLFLALTNANKVQWLSDERIFIDTEILPDRVVELEHIPSIDNSCHFEAVLDDYTLVTVDGCRNSTETIISILSDLGIEELHLDEKEPTVHQATVLSHLLDLLLNTISVLLTK